jgi:DivIVA domain-containing protein
LRGYSTRDVDRDLATIADALEAGDSIDPATLTDRAYPKSLRGYDVEAVRSFLDEVHKRLTAEHG